MLITPQHRRTTITLAAGWVLLWLLLIAVAVQDYQRSGRTAYWEPVLWEGSSAIVATLLVALQRYLSRGTDRWLDRPARWFALQLRWLPLICIGFVAGAFGLRHMVYALIGSHYHHESWGNVLVYESIKLSLFFGIFTAVVFGVLSYRALLAEKERAGQSAVLLRQAQLQHLTQQIQPHFLFNALNAVSSLMHADVQRADATLARLSDVLRASLDLGQQPETEMRRELQLLRAYADVMTERFADRIAIAWAVSDDALSCKVPSMGVQPLLENVFKHTVERQRGFVHIRISAACADGVLRVVVEDDAGTLAGDAADGRTGGMGLKNLRERLVALHGDSATLSLSSRTPSGVRAEMRVPCAC